MHRLQLLRCGAALAAAPILPRLAGAGGRAPLLPPAAPRPQQAAGPHRPFRGTQPVEMGRRAAKIANRKGKADAVKAKLYGRIGKTIVQAVKAGGGADPAGNSRLAEVLKRAKEVGAPKDLIERNLRRASDAKQADYAELVYEALSCCSYCVSSVSGRPVFLCRGRVSFAGEGVTPTATDLSAKIE